MEKYNLVKICEHQNMKIYGNDFYRIRIEKFAENGYKIDIERVIENLPNIFARMEYMNENSKNKFRVQSIEIHLEARGFKKVEEIANVMEKYSIAMETAKEIEKLLDVK